MSNPSLKLQLVKPTSADHLELVQDLLCTAEDWTKGCLARDAAGKEVHFLSPDAKKFCLMGAVQKIMHMLPIQVNPKFSPWYYVNSAAVELGYGTWDMVEFNDLETTTFEDIKKLIAHAVNEARTKEIE